MMNNIYEIEEQLNDIREAFGMTQLDYGWLEELFTNSIKEGKQTFATAGFVFRVTENSVRVEIDPEIRYWLIPKDIIKESARFSINWKDEFEEWSDDY